MDLVVSVFGRYGANAPALMLQETSPHLRVQHRLPPNHRRLTDV